MKRKKSTRKRVRGKNRPPSGVKNKKTVRAPVKPAKEPKESGYDLRDEEVQRALMSHEYAGRLESYLGEENYQELSELAREAAVRSVRGGPRVLILPGIMGSKLGKEGLIFDDVVWFDPVDVALGNLAKLALNSQPSECVPVGVIQFAYLKLKLRLRIAGYDAGEH